MPDWKTRLAVSFQDDSGTHEITPIDSFSPTFALNGAAMHSIEATHIGVIFSPDAMSFTMTVKAIGDPAAELTILALEHKRFDIVLQESDGGTDWSFKKIVMSECVITSAAPTAASPSGAPSATFSGFSLAADAEPKTGTGATLPK
jgi:hypothetical protein